MELKVQRGVQATPSAWDRWDKCADKAGKTRQEWVRDTLNAAAAVVERKATGKGAK